MSRKRIPLNQNGCTANFRIGVPFEQNLHFMNLDTSLTENMSFMFKYLGDDKKLELDCSGFDTGNVTSMESMFDTTYAVKIDVSGFNTSKVTTMESMFNDSQSIRSLDLSSFDTSM